MQHGRMQGSSARFLLSFTKLHSDMLTFIMDMLNMGLQNGNEPFTNKPYFRDIPGQTRVPQYPQTPVAVRPTAP